MAEIVHAYINYLFVIALYTHTHTHTHTHTYTRLKLNSALFCLSIINQLFNSFVVVNWGCSILCKTMYTNMMNMKRNINSYPWQSTASIVPYSYPKRVNYSALGDLWRKQKSRRQALAKRALLRTLHFFTAFPFNKENQLPYYFPCWITKYMLVYWYMKTYWFSPCLYICRYSYLFLKNNCI